MRARDHRAALLALLLFAGCHRVTEISLPDLGDVRPRSAFLVVLDGDEAPDVWAAPAASSGVELPPIVAEQGATLAIVYFEQTLESQLIRAGRVEAPKDDAPSRKLLDGAIASYQAVLGQDTLQWVLITARDERLERIVLPARDPADCADKGGCYRDHSDAQASLCTEPCPSSLEQIAPNPPEMPALPDLRPCLAGFSEELVATASVCRPRAALVCPEGQVHPLDSDSCRAVGTPCADRFPAILSGGNVVYVAGNEASGGDGTRASPYNSIAEALARTTPPVVLALANDVFSEIVRLDRADVELAGACTGPNGTQIAVDTDAVQITAPRSTLRNLTISGRGTLLMIEEPGADATLDGVQLDGGLPALLARNGARVTATDLAIGGAITGVVLDNAAVSIIGAVIESEDDGVLAQQSALAMENVRVRTSTGSALYLTAASATVSHALFEGTPGDAVRLEVARLWLKDAMIEAPGNSAVFARTGSDLRMEKVLVEGGSELGVHVGGSHATIRDVVVRSSGTQHHLSRAIDARGANIDVERLLASNQTTQSLYFAQGTVAALANVTVFDMDRAGDGKAALAITEPGTRVRAEKVHLERIMHGVTINAKAIADLRHVIVRDALGESCMIVDNAGAVLERIIAQQCWIGLEAHSDANVTARDLRIAASHVGIVARTSSFIGTDFMLEECTFGFWADSGEVTIERLLAAGSQFGILAGPRNELDRQPLNAKLTNVVISRNQQAGISISEGNELGLERALIRGNGIGVLYPERARPADFMVQVRFEDNVVDLLKR